MVFSFFKKPEVVVPKPAAKPAGGVRPPAEDGPAPAPVAAGSEAAAGAATDSGMSDFVFSEISSQFHVEAEIDPVDATAQEAAILYANAQDPAVRVTLETAVRQFPFGPGERLWLMLFDFYQLQADRAAFDALSVEYARAFEKSPPAWRAKGQAESKTSAVVAGTTLFKGELCGANAAGFAELEKGLASSAKFKLDLSRVRSVDAAGCERLLALLQQAHKAKRPVELLGRDALGALLEAQIKLGLAEQQGCWLLQLELLQLQGQHEAFENLAVDYAVTFEVSPPSWEAARVAAPEAAPAKSAESERPAGEAYRLEGEIKGLRFQDLLAYADTHDYVLIDCAGLQRIDFVSAGALLNALTGVRNKGRQIVFQQPHRLIAELFVVVGLHAVATIALAKN